jgi:uncharacterized repeat protein (TIGR01451 family)
MPVVQRVLSNLVFCIVVLLVPVAAHAQGEPTFSKVFFPNPIGPDAVSRLTYTITNIGDTPVTDLAFTEMLPTAVDPMLIAKGDASTTCDDAVLTAVTGTQTVSITDGRLGPRSSCTVTLNVTAGGVAQTLTATSGSLTSSLGVSTASSADLEVATSLPGFTQSFSPSAITLGGTSTMTFTFDNTANPLRIGNLDFTSFLPAGLEVADPANDFSDCVSAPFLDTTVTAVPGTGTIVLDADGDIFSPGFEVLAAGASCSVIVDVKATGIGTFVSETTTVLADFTAIGYGVDTLTVTADALNIAKEFTDDPVAPGGTVTLEFTIDNFSRSDVATNVAFTDDLSGALAGLTFSTLLSNDCGGSVGGVGTTQITFTGGTVASGGQCTIRTSLDVPAGAAPGSYSNTTSTVTGTVAGNSVIGTAAAATLFVSPAPVLTVEVLEVGTLIPDPIVLPGGSFVMRYTLTNTSTTSALTDGTFVHDLIPPLPFPVTVSLPPTPNPPCGAGSSFALVSLGVDDQGLALSGASLAAASGLGDSCTFDVTLTLPGDLPPNTYEFVTEAPSATVDGATRTGKAASDTMQVGLGASVSMTKSFAGSVAPDGSVDLTYELTSTSDSIAVIDISFADDFEAVLTGATLSTPLPVDPCGVGSTLTATVGDSFLTLDGGSLAASGDTCSFTVTLDVPPSATPGLYPSATSDISATVSGQSTTFPGASADLLVSGVTFSKVFDPASVIAGDVTTLRYTIENVHPTDDASIVFFNDTLTNAIPNLAATGGASVNTCGGTLSGTTTLSYNGGSVLNGQSCEIEVELLVPSATADTTVVSASSTLSTSLGSDIAPAVATLTVNNSLLLLSKVFDVDSSTPGDTVTVAFTLTNSDPTRAATAVAFTDDLDVMLSGTIFDSVASDNCSATISGTGGSSIDVSGVSLAAGASCVIEADVIIPASAGVGAVTNTTSAITGTIGGLAVDGDAAIDSLDITNIATDFSKSFDGPSAAGGTAMLTFTITNLNAGTVDGLSFTDDLDAVLSGLVASSLPSAPCGVGSSITGTSVLSFSGGELPGLGGTCSFSVEVTVPSSATAGTYANTTSSMTSSGQFSASAATASLVIVPPPSFAKAFNADTIATGQESVLTFTIDNSGSSLSAASVSFTDTLPAGVVVSASPAASSTCSGGVLTATASSGTISFTGGSVSASSVCTIQANVTSATTGTFVNTSGALTSSLGNSGTATDTLTVVPQPGFSKSFSPDPITLAGGVSTLTFTIDNSGSSLPASSLTFSDTLPTGMIVATPSNATTTCTGGTLTAADGTGTVSYSGGTVSSVSSCTLSVDVAATQSGTLSNTSGELTSSLGSSGTAADTLTVITPEIDVSGSIGGAVAVSGTLAQGDQDAASTPITLDITVTNNGTDTLNLTSAPTTSSLTNVTINTNNGTGPQALATGGGTYVFRITYTPISAAGFSFDVSIPNDDVDEDPYTFTVSGTGLDVTAPTGYSAAFDQDPVNVANETAVSFTFAGAEVGATYAFEITSDAGGTPVTGTGTIATATDQISGLDLSGLGDGTLTLTVALTDPAGNAGGDQTATAAKDATAPSVTIDTPLSGDGLVSAAEAPGFVLSGTSSGIPDGNVVEVDISVNGVTLSGLNTTVTGDVWTLPFDMTFFSDGTISVVAVGFDQANNPSPQATATGTLDTAAPTGYSAAFDQDPVNIANETAVSFTFAGAEVGATYEFEITSDAGGTPVTGTGTIATATDQISGLDLSGLGDGTLTLTVALTDPAGNAGADQTATATKDVAAPTAVLTGPNSAQSDPFFVAVEFSEAVTGFALTSVTIDNGVASALTGSGNRYIFTVTPDHDGTVEISLDAAAAIDAVGNPSVASAAIQVTADLTGTPNPFPPADADGDGTPDFLESFLADRDGDNIPDASDFDPQGYFYCEDDGRIIPGGSFTVTGPFGSNSSLGTSNFINITRDGSTGEIQWFALVPGTFSMSLTYPTAVGIPSTARLSSGSLDLTSLLPANPAVIGSTEVGSTGFLADGSLAANPQFYSSFDIEAGDPFVLANNIPMTQCATNSVTVTAATDGAEANGGVPTNATFTVSQGRLSTQDTVVGYTVTGTATSGTDFTALSGSVTILAGDTSATVTVPVLEDGDIEGPETVILTLAGVTSGDLSTQLGTTLSGTATITDDDFAVISVTNNDLVTNEGGGDDASMSFALLGAPTSPVTLSFAGDAQCTVAPATMTFTSANYGTPQVLTIRAIDDDKVEGTHSCQPTVAVTSTDVLYDATPLALAAVTVTDDLVDQVREPLTAILEDDLSETILTQQRAFNRMAKGALQRLQSGQDVPCGTIEGFDIDGSLEIKDATGTAQGTFGSDTYNCVTDTREILDGSFSLNKTEDTGLQALLQFAFQRERFVSDNALAGYFLGGYFSRTDVSGLGDGTIDGFGVNGGLYGAQGFGDGLFLDYYLAAAAGHHRFDIAFDAAAAPINATGDYSYAAGFAGAGISGQREFDNFVMKPRVAIELAYALAGDADVTAQQLGLTHTGVIDIEDFQGIRTTAEVSFESIAAPGGSEAMAAMMRTALTPRLVCDLSSYEDDAECGLGLAFSWERTNTANGLTFGFEVDVESVDDSRRLTINMTRERPIAQGRGAVVTRLSMPQAQTWQLEHGVRLDF